MSPEFFKVNLARSELFDQSKLLCHRCSLAHREGGPTHNDFPVREGDLRVSRVFALQSIWRMLNPVILQTALLLRFIVAPIFIWKYD